MDIKRIREEEEEKRKERTAKRVIKFKYQTLTAMCSTLDFFRFIMAKFFSITALIVHTRKPSKQSTLESKVLI